MHQHHQQPSRSPARYSVLSFVASCPLIDFGGMHINKIHNKFSLTIETQCPHCRNICRQSLCTMVVRRVALDSQCGQYIYVLLSPRDHSLLSSLGYSRTFKGGLACGGHRLSYLTCSCRYSGQFENYS